MTAYEILGVDKNASEEEIKKAYKYLCKQYHPDIFSGDPAFAEKMMKSINAAYEELINGTNSNEDDESFDNFSNDEYEFSEEDEIDKSIDGIVNGINTVLSNFDNYYEQAEEKFKIQREDPPQKDDSVSYKNSNTNANTNKTNAGKTTPSTGSYSSENNNSKSSNDNDDKKSGCLGKIGFVIFIYVLYCIIKGLFFPDNNTDTNRNGDTQSASQVHTSTTITESLDVAPETTEKPETVSETINEDDQENTEYFDDTEDSVGFQSTVSEEFYHYGPGARMTYNVNKIPYTTSLYILVENGEIIGAFNGNAISVFVDNNYVGSVDGYILLLETKKKKKIVASVTPGEHVIKFVGRDDESGKECVAEYNVLVDPVGSIFSFELEADEYAGYSYFKGGSRYDSYMDCYSIGDRKGLANNFTNYEDASQEQLEIYMNDSEVKESFHELLEAFADQFLD